MPHVASRSFLHRSLPVLLLFSFVAALSLFPIRAHATVIFLTSGTSWTVPSDWNSANNTIEVIGGGGNGATIGGVYGGGGGGGGAYSKSVDVSLTPDNSVTYAVGGVTGDTYFCNSTSNCASIAGTAVVVGAKGGISGSSGTGGSGGDENSGVASGTGFIKNSGGTGANSGGVCQVGGGGGGAAGSTGDGNNGSSSTGGSGDAGAGGAGGGTGTAGSPGTEWDSSHGSGGGGGGSFGCGGAGAAGGLYGAGGGGGSLGAGGAGKQGIIVITYTPVTAPSVTTNSASAPTPTAATLFGSITDNGGSDATQYGFAYGTTANLSTVIATTTLGSFTGTGSFANAISSLSADTTYYYRAYATNSGGTGYGSILSFSTGNATPARKMRLFEGARLKLISGRLIIYQQ